MVVIRILGDFEQDNVRNEKFMKGGVVLKEGKSGSSKIGRIFGVKKIDDRCVEVDPEILHFLRGSHLVLNHSPPSGAKLSSMYRI